MSCDEDGDHYGWGKRDLDGRTDGKDDDEQKCKDKYPYKHCSMRKFCL